MLPEPRKASLPTEPSCAIQPCALGSYRTRRRHGSLQSFQTSWGNKAVLDSDHTVQATWRSTPPTCAMLLWLPASRHMRHPLPRTPPGVSANFYSSFAFPAQVLPARESPSWPPTPSPASGWCPSSVHPQHTHSPGYDT